jgi:hypothetical protein
MRSYAGDFLFLALPLTLCARRPSLGALNRAVVSLDSHARILDDDRELQTELTTRFVTRTQSCYEIR